MTNARESVHLYDRRGLVVSVLGLITYLIGGFLISYGLIHVTWSLEEWQKGALSIVLPLMFLFFFINPYRMWSSDQTKINALEDRLKPRLSVGFQNSNPHFEATIPKYATGHAIRTFRIRVENIGTEPLDHCCVNLDELIGRNSSRSMDVDLKFRFTSDNRDSRKLGPGEHAFVDIVEMDENDSTGFFTLCYAIPSSRTNVVGRIPRTEGPHQLTIKVIGGPAPITQVYKIAVNHDGFLTMGFLK